MDAYAPMLCDLGLIGMIGKGQRSAEVIRAIQRNGGVYFAATGGAGALIAGSVRSARVIAYDDLGAEAIRELQVENLPLIVAIDAAIFTRKGRHGIAADLQGKARIACSQCAREQVRIMRNDLRKNEAGPKRNGA